MGPTGPQGITGVTGPAGHLENQTFAYFSNYGALFENAAPLKIYPSIDDTTGQIEKTSETELTLQPGFYQIDYRITAMLSTPGYMQITPVYSGSPHIEFGAYDNTSANNEIVIGTNVFIIEITTPTTFYLQFNSPSRAIEGTVSLAIYQFIRKG